jgi:hypothetical protein
LVKGESPVKKITVALVIGLLATLQLSATASASINQFAGKWDNVDSKTGGLTHFDITTIASKVYFHGYGRCTPRDCDWGEAESVAYAPSAGSDVSDTAQALTVRYERDYADTTIVIQPINGNRLRVETFTHFKDRSQRSDYMSVETFSRNSC